LVEEDEVFSVIVLFEAGKAVVEEGIELWGEIWEVV
jgi:hypothetical protein